MHTIFATAMGLFRDDTNLVIPMFRVQLRVSSQISIALQDRPKNRCFMGRYNHLIPSRLVSADVNATERNKHRERAPNHI